MPTTAPTTPKSSVRLGMARRLSLLLVSTRLEDSPAMSRVPPRASTTANSVPAMRSMKSFSAAWSAGALALSRASILAGLLVTSLTLPMPRCASTMP